MNKKLTVEQLEKMSNEISITGLSLMVNELHDETGLYANWSWYDMDNKSLNEQFAKQPLWLLMYIEDSPHFDRFDEVFQINDSDELISGSYYDLEQSIYPNRLDITRDYYNKFGQDSIDYFLDQFPK